MPLGKVPSRRTRRGVYVGRDSDRPSINLDATPHQIDAGATTTVHRHSWDAIIYIESGSGWSEIDGQRIELNPRDTMLLDPLNLFDELPPLDAADVS